MVEGEGGNGQTGLDRRSVLLSMGTGIGVAVSGCTAFGTSSQSTPTETDWETETSGGSTPTASETATETTEVSTPRASQIETEYRADWLHEVSAAQKTENDPVAFADLSADYQLAVANAITRTEYLMDRYPEGPSAVRYRGSTFRITRDTSPWYTPSKTPGGSGWRPPLSLAADVEEGSLVLSATNEHDAPVPVHHYARPSPYFSLLVAVSDEPRLLAHDGYDAIPALQSEPVVRIPSGYYWNLQQMEQRRSTATPGRSTPPRRRTDDERRPTDTAGQTTETDGLPPLDTFYEQRDKSQSTSLDPGESLRESYGLPSDLPPESKVWISLPFGDESTDVTGGREWRLTATITLEA